MASGFQRSKIAGVFDAMDADGDGYLDESDFRALTARWTALRGGSPDSRIEPVMMGWWDALLAASDRDDRVDLDDVLVVVDRLGEMPEAMVGTVDAMFDVVESDGDGSVSPDEYGQLVEAWAGRSVETSSVFPLLDVDGDGHISRDEFAVHWTEFWAGDDAGAPGTWLFGRFELPAVAG